MSSIAPEIFAFLPPEPWSPIPAAPSSSNNITSNTANPRIFAGKFRINASFAWEVGNVSPVASGRPAQQDDLRRPHRELQASAAQASAGASLLPVSHRPKIA
jgi:hypothetical protein